MILSRRRKVCLITGIAVLSVVVFSLALGLGLGLGLKKGEVNYEPTADSLEPTIQMRPKILDIDATEDVEPGHWTFVMEDTNGTLITEVLHDFDTKPGTNWTITGTYNEVGVFSMTCTKEILLKEAMPLPHMQSNVLYVEPVYKRHSDRPTSLWGLDRLDQPNPSPLSTSFDVPGNLNGAGVTVYVLDSGLRSTHLQFSGRVVAGEDFIKDGQGTNDCDGHGTHVAGTAVGNTFGVANGAKVAPVRVLGCDGSGTSQGVISGINWVTANARKPAVATMSLGGQRSTAENTAVERALAAGIPFAVAAGNDNSDACQFSPASVTNAVTVAAIEKDTDQRSSYSNFGTCVDIFAPGTGIVSAGIANDNAQISLSGTSMATPHVAGVMALILQKNPTFTVAQVSAALFNGSLKEKVTDPQGSPNRLVNVAFLETPATSASSSAATSAASSAASSASTARVTTAATTAATTRAPSTAASTAATTRAATTAATTRAATTAATTRAATTAATTRAPTATSAPALRLTTETGKFRRRGQARYHPDGLFFYNNDVRAMHAKLVGPDDADLDLALLKWENWRWRVVAESENVLSKEEINTVQGEGFYTWRVSCFKGDGEYTLTFST